MSIGQYFLLFFSVILGGTLAFYIRQQSKDHLQLILSFSGAYILGISVLHLMPTVFVDGDEKMGLWVLLGFFIQLILEQLSGGVEHGHIHAHQQARPSFALQIMLGLCIHAFLEGMPLGNYEELHQHHHHGHDTNHLLLGIILHKAPAAFALVLLLLFSQFKNRTVFFCLFLFALMSPFGAATADYLHHLGLLRPELLKGIVAIVIGSFLHIATTILFEVDSSDHHKISWKKMLAIIVGIGAALMTLV